MTPAHPGNRTINRAEALAADGAVVASSPAEAVRGATIVITMLADGPATEQAAQASGATLPLTSALLPRWRDTAASGHADDDLSAVYLTA